MTRSRDVVTIRVGAAPTRPATRPAPARATDAARQFGRKVDKVGATLDRMGDSMDRLAAGLRTLADRRRAMLDAAAQPSPLVSATSGYVRDSAGNRVRPMTPADLNDAADRHYRRGRYASVG